MKTPGYNPGAAEDPTTSPDIVDPDAVEDDAKKLVEEVEEPLYNGDGGAGPVDPLGPDGVPADGSEGGVPFAQ